MGTHSQRLRVSRVLLSGSLLCALGVPAFAGDGTGKTADASSPNANAATPTRATSPKPDREKKIYTNEDVEALARNYGASNVGNARQPSRPRPLPSSLRAALLSRDSRPRHRPCPWRKNPCSTRSSMPRSARASRVSTPSLCACAISGPPTRRLAPFRASSTA